jgi:hypothetical protein
MFCDEGISADDEEQCRVHLEVDWTDGTATYWCHGQCLQAATHPAVPLYVLSLRRDEAVFGTKPVT